MHKNKRFARVMCIVLIILMLASTCAVAFGSCAVPEPRLLESAQADVDVVVDSDAI